MRHRMMRRPTHPAFGQAETTRMTVATSVRPGTGRMKRGSTLSLIRRYDHASRSLGPDPTVELTTTPNAVMKYAKFMNQIGTLRNLPAAWKELFRPSIHAESGS